MRPIELHCTSCGRRWAFPPPDVMEHEPRCRALLVDAVYALPGGEVEVSWRGVVWAWCAAGGALLAATNHLIQAFW